MDASSLDCMHACGLVSLLLWPSGWAQPDCTVAHKPPPSILESGQVRGRRRTPAGGGEGGEAGGGEWWSWRSWPPPGVQPNIYISSGPTSAACMPCKPGHSYIDPSSMMSKTIKIMGSLGISLGELAYIRATKPYLAVCERSYTILLQQVECGVAVPVKVLRAHHVAGVRAEVGLQHRLAARVTLQEWRHVEHAPVHDHPGIPRTGVGSNISASVAGRHEASVGAGAGGRCRWSLCTGDTYVRTYVYTSDQLQQPPEF